MVHTILIKHKSVDWVKMPGLCFRGRYFDAVGYHENEDVLNFANGMHNEADFVERISGDYENGKGINGNFSVIFENDDLLLAAVDRIATFPLFYSVVNGELFISDSVAALRDGTKQITVDKTSLDEFRASGFILENRTMYKNILKLEAGQYLSLNKHTNEISINNYFEHLHMLHEEYTLSEEELVKKLDQVVLDVFNRMIESLNGRTVVLFLSGGYDSRLIAVSLKRLNYDKVICVSYGLPGNLQAQVAYKVATALGYPWIFVKTDASYWGRKRKEGFVQNRLSLASNGVSYPYLTGVILEDLIKSGQIPSDCAAVTGLSGDVLEGDFVSHAFFDHEKYSKTDVIAEIAKYHFFMNGHKKNKSSDFYAAIGNYIRDQHFYTAEEAEDFFELTDWKIRESQYAVNDTQNYDSYLGIDWRLPLWDYALIDFWLKVPYKLRYDRKLYYKYVSHENLPSANHTVTNGRKLVVWVKKTFGDLVRFGYPVKLLFQYIVGLPGWLCYLKLLTFSEFFAILVKTGGYRMEIGTALVYLMLRYNYEVDYFKD